jgi:nucleotide-binding universal stress UspA family protein
MTVVETLRVAPGPHAVGGIRRILLATDLSPASDGAAVHALDLAHDLGADLLVLSVIDPNSARLAGRSKERIDQLRAGREQAAQGLVGRGRQAGVQVSFLIWEGEPGEAIVDAAASEQVDMVVVGSHGRGSMSRLFIGSVSEYVVRHAPCPVLVVRARETAGTAGPIS